MKKYTTIKRLSALALLLILALAPAVPAKAADREVQIHPNSYTSVPEDGDDKSHIERFRAYQIFTGTIDNSKYQAGEWDDVAGYPVHEQPIANELSEARWGKGIGGDEQIKELLRALIMEDTYVKDMTFPGHDLFVERLLSAGTLYLQTPGLETYSEEYYKSDKGNWTVPEGRTEEVVGGTLTAEGARNLRNAIEADLAETDLTFGNLLVGALRNEQYIVNDGEVTIPADQQGKLGYEYTAEMVVRVLKDFTNPEAPYSREFAEDFAQKVSARKNGSTFDYLSSTPILSDWENGHWVFKDLQPGYYFIVDAFSTSAAGNAYDDGDTENGMAQSDFIVAVFGQQNVYVKTSAPTVEKVITNFGGGNAYGGDFEPGEPIKFRITGTLPENYDKYGAYKYIFTDTLSEGLSYQEDSMAVYAVDPGGNAHPLVKGSDFSITYTPGPTGTVAVIEVGKEEDDSGNRNLKDDFGNRNLKGLNIGEGVTAGWRFVAEYQATLNEKADFKNSTTAYLTYSSSSIIDGNTANTTKAVNYIYNFGVSIMKYCEGFVEDPIGGVPENPLEGAGFSLIKDNQYALFDENGLLSGWISQEDLGGDNIVWADIAEPDGKLTEDFNPDYAGKYIYFLTDSEGRLKDIGSLRGLKANTDYSLREVIVPEGYDEPDEHTDIRFEAFYYTGAEGTGQAALPGKLMTLRYRVGVEYTEIDPEEDALLANLELINYPTDALLDTGGMGTTLFYIGGGALLAGAALIWIVSRVKKKRNEKHVRYVNTRK